MNYIKKLEVYGFKSFYNRKELAFLPGMNVVMGPNGSGKSNIADGICFVLGKTSRKDLRTEKMGDLIYNGSKKLPKAKFAKVTITIDNSKKNIPIDDVEIRVSRKVDEEGRSIYKVNGQRQPKEYISTILAQAGIDPDGYNIIMQGEIEKFISLPTEERRKVLEDLSGIGIYEDKKHKCMLELDKVQRKYDEARLILNEKIKHMDELKKEKDQAENYNKINQKLNQAKANRIIKETQDINRIREGLLKDVQNKENEITEKLTKRQAITSELDSLNKSLDSLNKELEEKGGKEQVEISRMLNALRNRIYELQTIINSETKEIERIEERKKQLANDLTNNESLLKQGGGKKDELSLKIEDGKKHLAELEDRFDKLNNIDRNRVVLGNQLNTIEKEILEIREEINKFQKQKLEYEKRNELDEKLAKTGQQLSVLLDEESQISGELREKRESRDTLMKELSQLEGKREAMMNMLDSGTKAIMRAKDSGELKGIIGIVSDLGNTDEKYNLPIRAAAGGRINSIVVNDVDSGKEAMSYLRNTKQGIATFLPMDKINPSPVKGEEINDSGFIDFAINLVSFSPKFKKIFEFVFGDTIVVSDVDAAKRIGINKYRMVTLYGDLIDKNGSMQGGFRKKEGVGFGEEPIEEKMNDVRQRLAIAEGAISKVSPQKEELENQVSILRGRVHEIKEALKIYENFDFSKIDKLNDKIKIKETERNKIWETMKELPKKVAQDYLDKLTAAVKLEKDTITRLEGERVGEDSQRQVLERDIQRSNELLKAFEKEQYSFTKRMEENDAELKNAEKQIAISLEEEKKFMGKLKELYDQRHKLIENVRKVESDRSKMDVQIELCRREAQDLSLSMAEINAKLEGRRAALLEFKDIEVKEIRRSMEDLNAEVQELENKVLSFGLVNMRALEVYQQVEKEYNELKEKADKLIIEKEQILNLVKEVDTQKKNAFLKVFNRVSENFSQVFGLLSLKGEGRLILENPEDPFAGGVDIIAKPQGKNVVSLRSMSGGEKSLTTLAFIFSIQDYAPSPFYIMDEVDAALDKENAERLGKLISEYSQRSQFIIVSHQDSVVEQADNVYGVHMNQLGESHIVNIKMPAK